MYLDPHKSTDEAYHLANIISPAKKKILSWMIESLKRQIEQSEFESMMIRKYHNCGFYLRCRGMTKSQLNERHFLVEENLYSMRKELEEAKVKMYCDYEAREYFKQNPQKPYIGINLQNTTLIQSTLF